MAVFLTIPIDDIVHYSIMPWLDYNSRINLNQVLPPMYRRVRRFSKDVCESHELYVASLLCKSQMDRLNDINDILVSTRYQKKSQALLKLLTSFSKGHPCHILLRFPDMLSVFLGKLHSILDPNDTVLNMATPYFKTKLRSLAFSLLAETEAYECKDATHLRPVKPIVVST